MTKKTRPIPAKGAPKKTRYTVIRSEGKFVGMSFSHEKQHLVDVLISSSKKPLQVEPLRVKIAVVTKAFGSNTKAAEFLGVSRSQPGKWLSGEERPHPRARRLIQDFDYVWDRLTDDRSPELAQVWLGSANAYLNGATPLTWLKTRGPDEVIAAIDAEEAGSYA